MTGAPEKAAPIPEQGSNEALAALRRDLLEIHPIAEARKRPGLRDALAALERRARRGAPPPRWAAAVRLGRPGGIEDADATARLALDASMAGLMRDGRRILSIGSTFTRSVFLNEVMETAPRSVRLSANTTYVAFDADAYRDPEDRKSELESGMDAIFGPVARFDGAYVQASADAIDVLLVRRSGTQTAPWPATIPEIVDVSVDLDAGARTMGEALRVVKDTRARASAERALGPEGAMGADIGRMARAAFLAIAAVAAYGEAEKDPSKARSAGICEIWPEGVEDTTIAAIAEGGRKGKEAARALRGRGIHKVRRIEPTADWNLTFQPAKIEFDTSLDTLWTRLRDELESGAERIAIRHGETQELAADTCYDHAAFKTFMNDVFEGTPFFVIDRKVDALIDEHSMAIVEDMVTCKALYAPYDAFVIETPPWRGMARSLVNFSNLSGKEWLVYAVEIVATRDATAIIASPHGYKLTFHHGEASTQQRKNIEVVRSNFDFMGPTEGANLPTDLNALALLSRALCAVALMGEGIGLEQKTRTPETIVQERRKSKGLRPLPTSTTVRVGSYETIGGAKVEIAYKADGEATTTRMAAEVHLRRGHARRIAVGEGRAEREWRWFPSTVVGYLPDGTKPSKQAMIARRAAKPYRVKI